MWFDVGIKRYTTPFTPEAIEPTLWFDVGIKRYTTYPDVAKCDIGLWFDVGIKRYTTERQAERDRTRCGLM